MLRNQNGQNKIKQFTTENDIQRCKAQCSTYYTFKLPNTLPPPPRDPELGKTPENPAQSCSDIKKWGE